MQVKLKVLVGKSAGKEIAVPIKRFLIGRADDCHMRPKSEAISRNHCAIMTDEDTEAVSIRDLNSRNGTFVNGDRIEAETELSAGDHLQVGRLEFEVVIKDRKPKPEPAKVTMDSTDGSPLDFDVSEWLEEADADEKASRRSDPETRQFKLDETDRIKLEQAKAEEEAAAEEESAARPEKKEPGKLPAQLNQGPANSRDAAAEMLKKFFNNR